MVSFSMGRQPWWLYHTGCSCSWTSECNPPSPSLRLCIQGEILIYHQKSNSKTTPNFFVVYLFNCTDRLPVTKALILVSEPDPRWLRDYSYTYLIQRLSVSVQRGNAALVLGTIEHRHLFSVFLVCLFVCLYYIILYYIILYYIILYYIILYYIILYYIILYYTLIIVLVLRPPPVISLCSIYISLVSLARAWKQG